ncbi:MAG: carboxypeptidase M32 [Eubacterium sp.]|nr:carboxypeptidase M32 [Eubacterium sp.]
MDMKQAREMLIKLQSRLSAYAHAMESITYDGQTVAPKNTAENRAHALAVLSEEEYLIKTGEETVALLELLDKNKESLSPEENRMVFLLLKDIRRMQKIPMDEYIAYQELIVKAEDVWQDAKQNNDFASFEPYLSRIFETNIKFAKYCAPDMAPYDYWLGEYEDGLTMEICDEFFSKLRDRIVPLIRHISNSTQVDSSCLSGKFPVSNQEELSFYLMKTMGLNLTHCGLSTSEHPFTTSLGSHLDERITTHYMESNFASSMYSVIHEAGHALYDTGVDDKYLYTILDAGVSMGIHESQSRFYENLLGRSRGFITFLLPKLRELFPVLKDTDSEELYRAINRVEPSLIRTEADEVTYCLHVLVRYELEKKLMSGEISVSELPENWNKLYKEYIGVDVPDDSHGVLQDSHWAGGAIGYFPSYALGSAYGAHLLAKMKTEIDVEAAILKGDFSEINKWNKAHIWQYGSLYRSDELLEKALGEKFSADSYIEYLEKKYKEIYK